MKTLFVLFFALSLTGGCASVVKSIDQVKLVRDAINGLLPSDFKGDVDLARDDAFFNVSLRAANLHRNEKGEWTWDSVDYSRKTHIAAIGPAGWNSDVHVKLGKLAQ